MKKSTKGVIFGSFLVLALFPEEAPVIGATAGLLAIGIDLSINKYKERKEARQPIVRNKEGADVIPIEAAASHKFKTPPRKNNKKERTELWHRYLNGDIDLTELIQEYDRMQVKVVQINATDDGSAFQVMLEVRGKEEWVI